MVSLLPTILDDSSIEHHPFVLLQSTSTRSALPILRRLLVERSRTGRVVLLRSLYSLDELRKENEQESSSIVSIDWTNFAAGFSQLSWEDKQTEVTKALEKSMS